VDVLENGPQNVQQKIEMEVIPNPLMISLRRVPKWEFGKMTKWW